MSVTVALIVGMLLGAFVIPFAFGVIGVGGVAQ